MEEDLGGFVYPIVDAAKCVDCGLCEKSCPVLNHNNSENRNHAVFAAYAKNSEIRYKGSSGGMFGLLARQIISHGGIVYGAAMDSELHLKCASAETVEELEPLYKSKYIQSDLDGKFSLMKEQLDSGRKVLFVATPCQIYALKLFLRKEYDNLYTVDFVCHGVPSQRLFDRCREYEEKRDDIRFVSFQFRSKKKHGATPHYYTLTYEKNGKERKKTKLYVDSLFYNGFQKYITLRDSCYDCHFSHSNRCSDITIGDFHGIDKYISGINRFDGVSTVCINSPKGNAFWQDIQEETVYYPIEFSKLLDRGEFMCGGTKKPEQREPFLKALKEESFEVVVKKYLDGSKSYKKKMYYCMPKSIRNIMKKVLGMN